MDLPHLPRRKPKRILLLLLLFTLVSVLSYRTAYNFNISEWYQTMTVSFRRPEFEPKSSPSAPEPTERLTTPTPQRPQPCTYKYISPGNAEEGRALLDSIAWPDTPPLSEPFSLNLTTCPAKSSFTIVPQSGGWRVGDELTVRVQLRDYNGNPKRSGGDFLYGRLYNRALGAGVVGQVQDHLNGTFTVVFPLLWNGTANAQVVLVQTAESITVLKRLTEEQPDRVFFVSEFRSGKVTQRSTCNVCLPPGQTPLCNFTDLHTGEQWLCYKPPALACDTRVTHMKGGFKQRISKEEETLFQKGINMNRLIPAAQKETLTVLPEVAGETKKIRPGPSGYYYKDQWRALGGAMVRQFNDASVIKACLRGKQLYLFGDSTIRQFYQHITATLPDLLTFDRHSSPQSGPFLAVDHTNDIVVTYHCHGPPLRFTRVPVSQLRYVANELDGLVGGPSAVVVIGVWSHFSTFPLEVYYQRLVTIRAAVRRLQNRAPGTRVIVRTANLKDPGLVETLSNSDWDSLQRDKVLRAVFRESGVLLLDSWEMGQAHYLPNSLHPQSPIIKLMMDVILSYTCPHTGG